MVRNSLHSISSLSWQSLLYGVGVFGRQIIVYLTLPVLTRYLTQEEYGIIAISMSFLSFVDILSNIGLPAAVFRFYNDAATEDERKIIIGSSFWLFVFFSVGTAIIIFLNSDVLSLWLFQTAKYWAVARLSALVLVVGTIVNFFSILLRLNTRPLAMGILSITQTVAQVFIGILLITNFNMKVEGYWWGQFLGSLLGLLVALFFTKSDIYFKFSSQWMRLMIVYSFPLVAETMSFWILKAADRPILSGLVGVEQVGIYEIGYRIGSLAGMIILPIHFAWPQFAYSAMKDSYAQNLFTKALYFLCVIGMSLALGVTIFANELVLLFASPDYQLAVEVIPWIAFAMSLWGIYPMLGIGLMIRKKTGYVALITGFSALITVALNYILVPLLGIKGSAVSNFLGYLLLDLLAYFIGKKFYPLKLNFALLLKIALSVLLALALNHFILSLEISVFVKFGAQMMIIVVFCFILYVAGIYRYFLQSLA
jgi:O-antigen/teichoic acid export membrane protein